MGSDRVVSSYITHSTIITMIKVPIRKLHHHHPNTFRFHFLPPPPSFTFLFFALFLLFLLLLLQFFFFCTLALARTSFLGTEGRTAACFLDQSNQPTNVNTNQPTIFSPQPILPSHLAICNTTRTRAPPPTTIQRAAPPAMHAPSMPTRRTATLPARPFVLG